MKDFNGTLQYKGKDYKLAFSLNVMEEIQEEYGSLGAWGELTDGASGEVNAKALIFGLKAMLNEGIDIENEENGTNIPYFTHKQVGRLLTEVGIAQATQTMNDVVINSSKSEEKNA